MVLLLVKVNGHNLGQLMRFWNLSHLLNPFKPKGISHYYQLDQSISVLRVVRLYFSFLSKF